MAQGEIGPKLSLCLCPSLSTSIYIYIYIDIQWYLCTYIYMCVYAYIGIKHTHIYMYMDACVHTYMCSIYTCVCRYISVRVCTCVYIYIYIYNAHTYIDGPLQRYALRSQGSQENRLQATRCPEHQAFLMHRSGQEIPHNGRLSKPLPVLQLQAFLQPPARNHQSEASTCGPRMATRTWP